MAKKWRAVICEQEFREDLLQGSVQGMMTQLKTISTFPQILATPVLMYVLKQGVNTFCEPLDEVLE